MHIGPMPESPWAAGQGIVRRPSVPVSGNVQGAACRVAACAHVGRRRRHRERQVGA